MLLRIKTWIFGMWILGWVACGAIDVYHGSLGWILAYASGSLWGWLTGGKINDQEKAS